MNKIISIWHVSIQVWNSLFPFKMGFLSLEVQKQLLSNSERLRNLPKSMELIKPVLKLTLESDLKVLAQLLSEWW